MYKVIIVDDFEADRLLLKRIINSFTNLRIEIIGECENAIQALELIDDDRPDIVISDIEMPSMTGLEMAKKIKEKYNNEIKIIFCTLYNEFKYAKEAIYSNSYGYMLKPVQSEEMFDCIKRVTRDLAKETNMKIEYKNLRDTLESFKPVLVDNFLKEIIYGINSCESNMWEKAKYFGINIREGFFRILYVEIDDYEVLTANQNTEEKQLFSIKILEKIKNTLTGCGAYPVARIDEMHFAVIINLNDINKVKVASYDCAENIADMIRKINVSLTISLSDVTSYYYQIKDLFEQCKYIMRYKFIIGKGKIISSEDIPNDTGLNSIDTNLLQKDVRYLLNSGTKDEIAKYIDDRIHHLTGNANDSMLRNYCFLIVVCVRFTLNENNINLSEVYTDESLIWGKLQRFETIIDAANWIKNLLIFANEHLSKKAISKNSAMVDEIKKFIITNISKNIGLESLATELHYSPNYLNFVFKQESGETINDYITRMKIDKAREMLSDVRNKVQDISDSLGYSHAAYFCSVFKKITGITPKEYRERVI